MVLIRFLIELLTFIGILASASAVALTVILMLRFPPILAVFIIDCSLFQLLLNRTPRA
ncbi:hypothetical protein [Pseudomonas sp. Ant30-3]|uniref:hypothetical protein n=1 Tax=Pseudomonas sp. Ant30-3 TaxID=1488328 RepID=UPI000A853811|nr:hypothetical protein [Pseudomonas sp. Ant30-3]